MMGFKFERLHLSFFCCFVLYLRTEGSPSTDLEKLENQYWDWWLSVNPQRSILYGSKKYSDLLFDMDIKQFDIRKEKAEEFLNKTLAIDPEGLTKKEKINHAVLIDALQTFINGSDWAMYGALNPISNLEWLMWPTRGHMYTRGDIENYIAQFAGYPNKIEKVKERLRKALALNRTLHQVSMATVTESIDRFLPTDDFETNVVNMSWYRMTEGFVSLSKIPATQRADVLKRARTAIIAFMHSLKGLGTFFKEEYLPHTRSEYGVYSWDPTGEYYRACLRWHLSYDVNPDQIHTTGLEEVARIEQRMKTIMAKFGFGGSVRQFFSSMKNDSQFRTNDTGQLLLKFQDALDRIDPYLPTLFNSIPNRPIRVRPKAGGTLASYGFATDVTPGYFFINVARPEETSFFEIMAVTLHETSPGHHFQHCHALAADLPQFRKNIIYSYYNIPAWMPVYSAYTEGWGLYAEYLGEEVGIYKDDYELIGRLSWEMLRAVRIVIDTGIHHYRWSRAEAIEYLLNYTVLGDGNAASEIDRFITWPGQACAYKIGEMKIMELRRLAEQELGDEFDIKKFHMVVLENGAMPLSFLETTVKDWISETKLSITGSGTICIVSKMTFFIASCIHATLCLDFITL